jgi:hypothetical protein
MCGLPAEMSKSVWGAFGESQFGQDSPQIAESDRPQQFKKRSNINWCNSDNCKERQRLHQLSEMATEAIGQNPILTSLAAVL